MGNDSPHFSPQKIRIWEDLGGQRPAASPFLQLWSGRSEGKKGRVGEKRPARAQNIGLIASARMARQRLSVAPGQVARPNGLPSANKNQYG